MIAANRRENGAVRGHRNAKWSISRRPLGDAQAGVDLHANDAIVVGNVQTAIASAGNRLVDGQ